MKGAKKEREKSRRRTSICVIIFRFKIRHTADITTKMKLVNYEYKLRQLKTCKRSKPASRPTCKRMKTKTQQQQQLDPFWAMHWAIKVTSCWCGRGLSYYDLFGFVFGSVTDIYTHKMQRLHNDLLIHWTLIQLRQLNKITTANTHAHPDLIAMNAYRHCRSEKALAFFIWAEPLCSTKGYEWCELTCKIFNV